MFTGDAADKAIVVRCRGAQLDATLTRPQGQCRAAVTLLHPADDPSRLQFLFEHLAMVLPERGIAALRYDRRPWAAGQDVPFAAQAEDLACGLEVLAAEVGWVPRILPEAPSWEDIDFDPAPAISAIRCPVLLFYGADEWVPVQDSISIWRDAAAAPAQLTICELGGGSQVLLAAGVEAAQGVMPWLLWFSAWEPSILEDDSGPDPRAGDSIGRPARVDGRHPRAAATAVPEQLPEMGACGAVGVARQRRTPGDFVVLCYAGS